MKLSPFIAVAMLVAACGSNKRPLDRSAATLASEARNAPPTPAMSLAAATGSELRVRLDQDLGPGVSPDKKLFTARVVAPLLDKRGIVIVAPGALVHGHVVHVDEAQHRVEIAFDRLETRDAVYVLQATVIAASPYALTVMPEGQATSNTALLQGVAPTAIGGGPVPPASEADEDTPRGVAIVPFDAELRLKLMGPVVPALE